MKGELRLARGGGTWDGPRRRTNHRFSSPLAVLGKAVHSLSRIGDELYLEPLEDGVRDWNLWVGGIPTGSPVLGLSLVSTRQDARGQICQLSFSF